MAASGGKKTKHQHILEYVRESILAGKFKAGERLPTDGQLVRQFSASRPTVARAMRDLEKQGYLERRTGSGSFVRLPAQARSSLIGLIVPELGNAEIFEPICSEIAVQCQKHNLSLLWAESTPSSGDNLEGRVKELCQRYVNLGVTGVFFAPVEFSKSGEQVNREIAERLEMNGIAVVLLDRDLERVPKRSHFDLVSVDNFRIGMLQADHLIDLGASNLAYVYRDFSAPTIELRIAGFRTAIEERGLEFSREMVFCGDPDDTEFARSILDKKPDAIVCSNDTTAAMLLRSLLQLDVKIPGDIRLIGVDDVNIARLTSVPLTTIRQSCRDIGSAAVVSMVKRIENRKMAARSVLVDVELVIRESCGASNAT